MNGTGRVLWVSVLAAVACVWYGSASNADLPAEGNAPRDGGMVSHVIQQDGRPPVVVVTHPASSVLAVYHIDPTSGALSLKSVRNISWDLKMLQFNSEDPSPKDVRAGIQAY